LSGSEFHKTGAAYLNELLPYLDDFTCGICNRFVYRKLHVSRFEISFFFLSFKELATVSLKVVRRKRRRIWTLKSYDRFTNK
jgi:hypothetical protein